MSTFRNPVGPQPTNVYWRRRLMVGLGIVAVVIVILLIVFAPKGGTPVASTSSPSASAPATTPVDEATDAPACAKGDVTVEAATDKAAYGKDQLPQLSYVLTNTSDADCSIDTGTDALIYTITSGDETIWTSTDCPPDEQEATTILAAGEKSESAPLEWDRTRSSATTCGEEGLDKVTAGGASYHLGVAVNGVISAKTRQIILN